MQQLHHPRGRSAFQGLPSTGCPAPVRPQTWHRSHGLVSRRGSTRASRAQSSPCSAHGGFQTRWQCLALGDHVVGHLQRLREDEAYPGLVDGRGSSAGLPFGVGERAALWSRVGASKPCGKTPSSTGMERKGPETSTGKAIGVVAAPSTWPDVLAVRSADSRRGIRGHRHGKQARRRGCNRARMHRSPARSPRGSSPGAPAGHLSRSNCSRSARSDEEL